MDRTMGKSKARGVLIWTEGFWFFLTVNLMLTMMIIGVDDEHNMRIEEVRLN